MVKSDSDVPWWKRRRYQMAIMIFFGCFNFYTLRTNMSVAIVDMTEIKNITSENGTTILVQDFKWDSTNDGVILSGFFYGYTSAQFISGYISERYGGAKFFGLGLFVTSLFTVLTPIVANYSYVGLIVVRVMEGIFEGMKLPACQAIWARWAPPHEKAYLSSFGSSGSYVGIVVAMVASGIICKSWSWEWVFYLFGGFGIFCSIIWFLFVSESPSEDKYITETEKNFITSLTNKNNNEDRKAIIHPWKRILTSGPVWALTIATFAEIWGIYTLLTQLPHFMKAILNFDISSSGYLSALPYLVTSITIICSGSLADKLGQKKWLTITQVRKTYMAFSFIIQTIFMSLAAFLLHPIWSTVCLTIAVGIGGIAISCYTVNFLDLGPSHASVITGFANTISSLPGIISPTLTGYIVRNNTEAEWRIVFYIASAIYIFGCIIYLIFGSGEVQKWSWDVNQKKEEIYNNINIVDSTYF